MATIQDFRVAWADKANRDAAFAIAKQYVEENAVVLEAMLGGKSSDELVQIIDTARAAGQDDVVTSVTMWELVKFERRNIGGTINQTVMSAPRLRSDAE